MKYLRFILLYFSIAILGKSTNYSIELFSIGLIGITLIYLSIQKPNYNKFEHAVAAGEVDYLKVTDFEFKKIKTLISVPLYFVVLVVVLVMYPKYGDIELLEAFTVLPVFVAGVAWTEKLAFPQFQYGIALYKECIREGAFRKKVKWKEIQETERTEENVLLKFEGGRVKAKLSESDLEKLKKVIETNCECEWNESTVPNSSSKTNARKE